MPLFVINLPPRRFTMKFKVMLTVAALVSAVAATLPVQAKMLRWAAQNDILTLDPHAQNHATTGSILQHAYEGLTRYNERYEVEPALATKWTQLSPTQVRFELRKGVTFHDGSPFTADDVVFSFGRIKQPQGTMQIYVTGVAEVKKLDSHTVDFILAAPNPILLRSIIDFRIVSKIWAEKNNSTRTQDYKAKEENYASRNSIEPYILRIPIATPVKTPMGMVDSAIALLLQVRLKTGETGWGEVWCNFPRYGAFHRALTIKRALEPFLTSREFSGPHEAWTAMHEAANVLRVQSGETGPISAAIGGVDIALWDIVGKRMGQPLWKLLGGQKGEVDVYASLGRSHGFEPLVEDALKRGFRGFKLRCWGDPALHLEAYEKCRAMIGSDMDLIESFAEGEPSVRGHSGPMHIERQTRTTLGDAFVQSCAQAGYPKAHDYNAGNVEGWSYMQCNTRKGWRCSTYDAYLKHALGRPNLRVETGRYAQRLLFQGTRVTGVETVRRDGERALDLQCFEAKREVIVCAGSYHSPALLERSGIGSAQRLQALGLPVVLDNPHVGENMLDHMRACTGWRVRDAFTINDIVHSLTGKVRGGLDFFLRRKGWLRTASMAAQLCVRSSPEVANADLKLQLNAVSNDFSQPGQLSYPIEKAKGLSLLAWPMYARSKGHTHITGTQPWDHPDIVTNFLSDPYDQDIVVKGLRLTRTLAQQAAFAPYLVHETFPGVNTQSDAELLAYAKGTGLTVYHAAGTCRMGTRGQAVVDARLRVHGLQGLRVADASIMPSLPASNTNAPAIMIGERAAHWAEMHFVAALDSAPKMRAVLCLFEGVATGAADGYARMADKPAATLLHLGCGLGNGLANLHNARKGKVPV
ncbi:hypothetical protein B566_EDAN018826, partial [Ephemera danica]